MGSISIIKHEMYMLFVYAKSPTSKVINGVVPIAFICAATAKAVQHMICMGSVHTDALKGVRLPYTVLWRPPGNGQSHSSPRELGERRTL